ncbi:hypothetical protein [Streptomyces bambusae]|uniref:Zinc ribbon domain-containing protein n=1 Tax=Streptomyces bambusae TaxID=1550616 RepID=A0ABS6ZD27_9ACTN|nr:hypothetical protein [Streptomyces bambusae]MBW5485665.1 hypothetical protein [Streptomyces bambusae]
MTHPPLAEVLTELDPVIADAPADAAGALWRLTGTRRDLDSNVIRLRPDAAVGEHAEQVLDVMLVVLAGSGTLHAEDGPHPLGRHAVAWLPKGSRRSLAAGPDGMTYLTVHTRRPGLGISPPSGLQSPPSPLPTSGSSPEGGEPACLLHRVCPDCGRLSTELDANYCTRCGSALPL